MAVPPFSGEILLITVSGEDKPGVTHSLTTILDAYGATILDMGQAVIHDTLSLGILAAIPAGADSAPLFKDLLFKGHELDLKIKFRIVDEDKYEAWVHTQGRPRHIVTLLGERIAAGHVARLTKVLREQGLNIDVITRLTGRIPLREPERVPLACVEFSVRGEPADADAMRAEFLDLARELGIDIAVQVDDVFRRNRRLVAFDMDSTLIQTEVIDELAEAAGVRPQVASITEAAMRGEIDYDTSLRQRLALLRGLDASVLQSISGRLPLTPGAERLITTLRSLGFKTAIISGGFTYFGERLKNRLGVDYVYANELEIVDGKLTGNVLGTVVNAQRKADLLRSLAEKESIRLEQVIAVGDGANDLPMLNLAGLGIAYHAKPLVRENSRHAISHAGLDAILYFIGVRDRDLA